MKIGDIIAKMRKKEELTEAETKFLETYKEPKADDSKAAQLQQQLDQEKTAREALQAKIDEAEGKDKTEAEKAQAALDKANAKIKMLEGERDAALAGKSALEYDNAVSSLAAEHKFTSRDYLKYKLQSAKVDMKDADAVKTFMESLKKDEAKFFSAGVNGGGGGSPPPAPKKDSEAMPGDRIGGIMQSLSEAPEVK